MEALLLVVLGVLGLLSWLVPIGGIVLMLWVASRDARGADSGSVGTATDMADMDRLVEQLTRQLGAYSNLPINKRAMQRQRISTMLTQMDGQMRHLDTTGRERYDLRTNQLSGMAAEAGIDWRAPSH